jgi:hypothetical protein
LCRKFKGGKAKKSATSSLLISLVLGLTSTVHAQYSGGVSCSPNSPGPNLTPEQWTVVPSLCVGESYDTNVYLAPKSLGLKLEDYVTTIAPGVRANGGGEYASGFVDVRGFGQTYVRNPNLNYVGFIGRLSLTLDNAVQKLFPNARLQIFDSGMYTPTPPSFVNPGAGTSPSDINNTQNAFAQGILAYRTNTLTNVASVVSSYAISPLTTLKASYSNSIIRYGSSHVGASATGLALFSTTSHTGTAAVSTQITGSDTISLTYVHGWINYQTEPAITFQTGTGTLGWSRTLTPTLKSELGGGVIVIDPGLTSWTGNAALVWTVPNHSVTLSYLRSVFPSLVGTVTPLIGNTVSLSARHTLGRDWQLTESASYINSFGATPSTEAGPGKVEYTTFIFNAGLSYSLTRIWSTGLSFSYLNYDSQFGLTTYAYPRYVVAFAISAALY